MRNNRSFVAAFAFSGAFVVMAVVAPGLAHAQGMTESAAEPRVWLGGHFGLSPVGTLKATAKANGNEASNSVDTATAFEVGAHFDVKIMPFLSVGLAPAVLLHVKGQDDTDSASQLDLPLRVTAGGNVMPQLRIYGFVAPGYTILFPPADQMGNSDRLSGFMVGFGGGVGFHVAPRFAVTGELGYQFRFPSETRTVLGTPVDLTIQANYLTFALGVVAGL
jgi:hypothetical protein